MKLWMTVLVAAGLALAPMAPAASQSASEPVDLELVFVLDSSSSVDTNEWRGFARGVAVAVQEHDVLPRDRSAVSVIAFGGSSAEVVVPSRRLEDENAALGTAQAVSAWDRLEGATPVRAGLRLAAQQVSHAGPDTLTTVCLIADGIENVDGNTVGDVSFLRDAGVDRFSVVATTDPNASEEQLRAEYGGRVFGDGVLSIHGNRHSSAQGLLADCIGTSTQVEAVIVNQGVQDADNTNRLVRNKSAVVRVVGSAGRQWDRWTGRLLVRRASDGRVLAEASPIGGDGRNRDPRFSSFTQRRRDALEFRVWGRHLRDEVTFEFVPAGGDATCATSLEATNHGCSVTLSTVANSRPVSFISFDVVRRTAAGDVLVADAGAPRRAARGGLLAGWLERGLPLHVAGYDEYVASAPFDATWYLDAKEARETKQAAADARGLTGEERDAYLAAEDQEFRDAQSDLVTRQLARTFEQEWRTFADGADRLVYGVFDVPGGPGVADIGDAISTGPALDARLAHLHETGHALGLRHPGIDFAYNDGFGDLYRAPCSVWSYTRWDGPTGPIGPDGAVTPTVGHDAGGRGAWGHTGSGGTTLHGVMEGNRTPSLMGYCNREGFPGTWISGQNWNRLLEAEQPAVARDGRASVGLLPTADGRWTIGDVRTRLASAPVESFDATHNLRITDASGGVTQVPVDLHFAEVLPSADAPSTDSPLVVPVPAAVPVDLPQGTAHRLELVEVGTGAVVGEQAVSANAPVVDLTVPTNPRGEVELTWTASDADGDALSFDVLVSSFGPWRLVATTTDSSMVVDASFVAHENSTRFRVVASDGSRTGWDQEQVLYRAEPGTPVRAYGAITAPLDGESFAFGELIEFSGQTEGLHFSLDQDGPRRSYWSDIDGFLRNDDGTVNAGDLSAGTHVITMWARVPIEDKLVRTPVDQIKIHVEPGVTPRIEPSVDRLRGADRFATAAAVAATSWPAGADTVVLATGEGFADALSAGPVGARLRAPVLLTTSRQLHPATADELRRLRPSRVVLVGGRGAISEQVEGQVAGILGAGATVERAAGPTRYATAAELGRRFFTAPSTVYVATGTAFPDALAGGAAAGWREGPVLLTAPDELPAEAAARLSAWDPRRVVVLGGRKAVGDDVVAAIEVAAPGAEVVRRSGPDRFSTAAEVSELPTAPIVWLATGENFPDGLAAAAPAGLAGYPVLLTFRDRLPEATVAALQGMATDRVVILGGERAVSKDVADQVLAILRAQDRTSAEE